MGALLFLWLTLMAFAQPTCAELTTHLTAVCPHAIGMGTLAGCEQWPAAHRECVASADSCEAFTACAPTALAPSSGGECDTMCAAAYRGARPSADELATCVEACTALVTPARRACWSEASSPALALYRCGALGNAQADACFVQGRPWCAGTCCADGEMCMVGRCVSVAAAPTCAETCSAVVACVEEVDLAECELACEKNLSAEQRECFRSTRCAELGEACGAVARPK